MTRPETKRALVVDDEDSVRLVLCQAIASYGFDVTDAENGRVALDLFEQADGGFDLLLTDIDMPEMNGCDLVCEIRKRGHRLPIVVVTGFARQEVVDRILAFDVSLFEKPIDFRALYSHIDLATRS